MFLISGVGGMLGEVMGIYFASTIVSIIGVDEGSGGRTLVVLAVGETDVAFLV